ncbi:hypothetical protein PHYBOEH_004313 [Phytophthora boehmeriae]|uniref:Uncharacterized protein n=1 Tax=Phytophthora boehmeriae TaxID=109152 RepID=A0A8T1XAK3_9STRA|nr:hypothetical protein PHYBOEH_004313 [Phytophthora boehmeriae]
MDWCAAVRRIATSSAEIRRCPDTFDAVLTTLLTLLDHEDVLVAYAAKKGLQSVLNDQRVGTQVANSIVVSLISSPPEVWKRKSSGFRFQLLRELIKTPVDVDGDASDDDIRETVDGGEEPGCSPYLQVVLVNLAMVGATVRNVCYSMAVTDGDGGRDHLVLLDLLVSNETRMLEYFMRYLRYLSAHWDDSKVKLHTGERLECVLSVLIRLRLEIDRLVTADLFPYNTKPLTRRLLAIEQLYESADA